MPDVEEVFGLATGEVDVAPSDSRWAAAAAKERTRLARLLGEVAADVQHVGSTAVPELAGKPILDIAVAYTDRPTIQHCAALLAPGQYECRGDKGDEGGMLFVRRSGRVRYVHVHLVPMTSAQWRNYLTFRDYLTEHPQRRAAYAALKEHLARRFPEDRAAYTAGKTAFVRQTLLLAQRACEGSE